MSSGGKKLSSKQVNGIILGSAAVVVVIGITLAVIYSNPNYSPPLTGVDTCSDALQSDGCSTVVTKDCYQCEDDPNPDFEGNYRCRCPAEPSGSGLFKCNTQMCVGPPDACPEDLIAEIGTYEACSWIAPGESENCSDYYQRGAVGGRGDPLPDAWCKYNPTTQACAPDYDRECESLPPGTTYPALEPTFDCYGEEISICADWTGGGIERESDAAAACEAMCIGAPSGGRKCGWSAGSTCYMSQEECHVTEQPNCSGVAPKFSSKWIT
jgi:hypothetical protein